MVRWGLAAVAGPLIAVAVPGPSMAATCSEELGIEVHGQHVVGDYVIGTGHGDPWPRTNVGSTFAGTGAAMPGGPGPRYHFPNGYAPGASFCNEQAQSARSRS